MSNHIQRASAVFSIVSEVEKMCKYYGINHTKRGPRPRYPDSYIISLMIIKNLMGMNSESSFLRYLEKHHGAVFTMIPERSWFNRKCRALMPVCKEIQQQLACTLTEGDIRIVDSTPVPVVKLYRGGYTPCFSRGIETIDVTNLTLVGDKGYYDGELRTILNHHGGHLSVPDKKRHTKFNTEKDMQLLRKRSLIETINEQLKAHMKIHETLAQSYEGLMTRIWSALLAFTFGMHHNHCHGRPLLSLKGILI